MLKRLATWSGSALLVGLALAAHAGIPTDQVKGATDQVLKTLQDPALKSPDKTAERRKQLRTIVDQVFDWQETGKRALARHWQTLKPEQRQEFSALFADLVERSYVGKIEAYSGEKVAYVGDTIEGDQATVKTKLITKSGTEIPLDYRMQKEGDRWRVYDVLIEGVSLVGNYRTQFNKIIQQSSYDELVKKMKTKQDELVFVEGPGQKGGQKTTP
ncbi:MAG: organic solvent tolerance ABC transporter substrate-binding protein [Candidatus Rokuibacteriota bacterium]|nr:MAG: organic solvent tolerance ABC transporter substrate-binding protein [Candidatus Rokubacteria bacterium]